STAATGGGSKAAAGGSCGAVSPGVGWKAGMAGASWMTAVDWPAPDGRAGSVGTTIISFDDLVAATGTAAGWGAAGDSSPITVTVRVTAAAGCAGAVSSVSATRAAETGGSNQVHAV